MDPEFDVVPVPCAPHVASVNEHSDACGSGGMPHGSVEEATRRGCGRPMPVEAIGAAVAPTTVAYLSLPRLFLSLPEARIQRFREISPEFQSDAANH
jgi:hypothetical protein